MPVYLDKVVSIMVQSGENKHLAYPLISHNLPNGRASDSSRVYRDCGRESVRVHAQSHNRSIPGLELAIHY